MDKIINLNKDLSERSIIARAKKELPFDELVPGSRHTVYFKAPKYNDLVIIERNYDKWIARKATDKEWAIYFQENINNKKNK